MFCVIQPPNVASIDSILTPTRTARPTWCQKWDYKNNLSEYKKFHATTTSISVKQWAIVEEIDELNMASQLPNFTLELHGNMKANWGYVCETFESYVTLMGFRPKYTAKEMAALKYALPKEARAVLKNSNNGSRVRINKTPPSHSKN